MAKEKLPKIGKRKWLNKGTASGYIIIDAEVERHWNKKKYPDMRTIDASVEIKDCNRQITLDFYAHNEKQYKERLAKLQLMIDMLKDLQTFMIDNPVNTTVKADEDYEDEDDDVVIHTLIKKVSETEAKEESVVDLGKVTLTVPREFVPSAEK